MGYCAPPPPFNTGGGASMVRTVCVSGADIGYRAASKSKTNKTAGVCRQFQRLEGNRRRLEGN